MNSDSHLVCLSGGIDSAVCLHMAKSKGGRLSAVTFNYGQPADEGHAALRIGAHYGVGLHYSMNIDIVPGGPDFDSKVQLESGRSCAYIPGRNAIMLQHAASLAETYRCNRIWFGAIKDDADGFPDCRDGFFVAMQSQINFTWQGGGRAPRIERPLLTWTKREVVAYAKAHGIPLDLTVSCYHPIDGKPCGKCESCALLAEAT